jgi:hypothetical protein
MRTLKAGLTYFALVFGAGFVLGAVRVSFLVPRLGMRYAELLEAPIMIAVVFFAARFVVRRFALPAGALSRLLVGATALALLLMAEVALVVVVQHQALGAYIASRDPVSGGVYLASLALFAAMPLLLRGRVIE